MKKPMTKKVLAADADVIKYLKIFTFLTREDFDAAWKDYIHLCRLGGSYSFTKLVEEAGLVSPFKDGCIESVIDSIEEYLNSVDDQNL